MFARRRKRSLRENVTYAVLPRTGWRRAANYFWKRVIRLSAAPHAVAAGAAAGAGVSFTPFIGFHFVLSFVVAFILRGNMLAAALGTAVGNPVTFPFIWGATHALGSWILSGGSDPIAPGEMAHAPGEEALAAGLMEAGLATLWPIIKPMLAGSLPLGLVAGLVTYVLVRSAVAGLQGRRAARLAHRRSIRREEAP